MENNIQKKNIMQKSVLRIDKDGNRHWYKGGSYHREDDEVKEIASLWYELHEPDLRNEHFVVCIIADDGIYQNRHMLRSDVVKMIKEDYVSVYRIVKESDYHGGEIIYYSVEDGIIDIDEFMLVYGD